MIRQVAVGWFGLVGLLLTLPAAGDDRCCGQEAEKGTKEEKAAAVGYTCPVWEIMPWDDEFLYYCDYFENNDCVDPTEEYRIGTYEYPRTCDDCPQYVAQKKPFPGFESPRPINFNLPLRPGRNGVVHTQRRVHNLTYKPDGQNATTIRVALFTVVVDPEKRTPPREGDLRLFRVAVHLVSQGAVPGQPGADLEAFDTKPRTGDHAFALNVKRIGRVLLLTAQQ